MLKVWIAGASGQIGRALNDVLDPMEIEALNTDLDEHRTDNILAQQIHIYISVSKIKRTGFNFREIQYVRN